MKCPFHIVGDIFMVENKYTSSKGGNGLDCEPFHKSYPGQI